MGKDEEPDKFKDCGKIADLLHNQHRRCNSFKIPQRSCLMTRRYRPRESPRRLETSFTQTCVPWVRSTCVTKLISKDRKFSESLNPEKGAPNDDYNLIREYKDGKGSKYAGSSTTDNTDSKTSELVLSVPFDKKPSIGTQERSKTVKLGLPVKKKSFAISRSNKPLAKKLSNLTKPEKKINKLVKKPVDPDDTSKPIKTEDKLLADKITKKKQVVKDKKSTFKTDKKTGASHSSKSMNVNDCGGPSYSSAPRNNCMIAMTNEKSTTCAIPNDVDSQSCSYQIVKRRKSGVRRNIPRSSVMTIWHWLRKRSCYTHQTPTKESSKPDDRIQDPFLSLFFPAMIASDSSMSRIIKDQSKKRKLCK